MKKIFYTLLLLLQTGLLFAHERPHFVERQQRQESTIETAYINGRLTDNEYKKLMKEQKFIKEAIETSDIDNHWSVLEHNIVVEKFERAEKKIRRYLLNTERY